MEPTPLQVSSYTRLLYKAQVQFSACRQSWVQNILLSQAILMKDQSLLQRSRNSGRDMLGGTNSFAGQLLHPSPVQSSRSIQHMQTVLAPKHFSISSNFDEGAAFASQIKKLRRRFTGWNQLLCRSALTPISCTKLKIHSAHADSPGSKTFYCLKQF